MKKILLIMACMAVTICLHAKKDLWSDGTVIDRRFTDASRVDVNALGRKHVITDYGVGNDSTVVQTAHIKSVISLAAQNGGGVMMR